MINWFYDNSYSLLTCDQLILWQLVLIADIWSTDSMTTRTHCWHVINGFYDNSYSLLICAWRCALLHWIVLKGKCGFTHYQEIKSKYNSVNYISTYLNVRQIFYWILMKTMIIPPWKRAHFLQTKKDRDLVKLWLIKSRFWLKHDPWTPHFGWNCDPGRNIMSHR